MKPEENLTTGRPRFLKGGVSMFGFRVSAVWSAVIGLAVVAAAQTSNMQQSKEMVVGLNLDSNYVRIADFLPRLRDSLVQQHRKQVRLVALDGNPQDAEDLAKDKACEYLLQLDILEITGGGVAYSTDFPKRTMSPEEERERRELGWVRVDYKLQSLKGDGVNVSDIDIVRYLDYPTSWDAAAFETTVFRTVTRVTNSTLGKLPKR
jgi:hypothetical protein